jgi:hypothetical protein
MLFCAPIMVMIDTWEGVEGNLAICCKTQILSKSYLSMQWLRIFNLLEH